MKRLSVGVILLVFALAPAVAAAASRPQAVSPGERDRFSAIDSRCPVFTWAAAVPKAGLQLSVFDVKASAATARLLYSIELPPGAHSWTASGTHCLAPGGKYAWSIRSRGAGEESAWSEARLFQVAAAPAVSQVAHALEILRRYLETGIAEERETSPGAPVVAGEEADVGSRTEDSTSGPESAADGQGVEISDSAITVGGQTVVTTATDQDTLGSLLCSSGQLVSRGAVGWACLAPTDLPRCSPGFDVIQCYSAPLVTAGVGVCRIGVRVCNASGTGFEACVGEVGPTGEVCDDPRSAPACPT